MMARRKYVSPSYSIRIPRFEKLYATEFKDDTQALYFAHIVGRGCNFWQFVHVDWTMHATADDGRQVGIQYPTKGALLADSRRYATEWGFCD